MRLPDFIGVGSPRCGTTWIAHVLNQHPDIYFNPNFKEIHFFDNNFHRGKKWYSKFFKNVSATAKCGEYTPNYMRKSESIARIARQNPDIKLIVSLRDPVQRAYSHYMQRKRFRNWSNDFDGTVKNNDEHILDFGDYGKQLKQLLDYFPQDQVHIIIFEEMLQQPSVAFADLFNFLGVSDCNIMLERAPKNQMITVRSKWLTKIIRVIRALSRRYLLVRSIFYKCLPGQEIIKWLQKVNAIHSDSKEGRMTEETRDYLIEYYAEDRLLLEQLLNRKIMEWSN